MKYAIKRRGGSFAEQNSLTAARRFNNWLKRTPALQYETGIYQSEDGINWEYKEGR